MKPLLIEWTEHLDTAEKRENFEKTLRNNTLIFARMQDILNKWEASILREETTKDQYATACWPQLQAHRNGNRETIKKLRDLISFV